MAWRLPPPASTRCSSAGFARAWRARERARARSGSRSASAIAGFVAAVRWVSAKPADYSIPMVAIGVGAMPPGMMFSILRGIDMVALITLPLVFGWSHWISIVIAVIAFGFLRSGVDRETMMEQQQEQRRQMEEAKAQREGRGPAASKEKIKVQRRR